MTKQTTTSSLIARSTAPTVWQPSGGLTPKRAGEVVCGFLDTATTSFGRATHYNSREEQQAAEMRAHQALMDLERDLYTALLTLPGVTDRARQLGTRNLLSTPRNGVAGFLRPEDERAVLYHMIQALPPQRMLKLIQAFQLGNEELGIRKANNARTRKLILRTLLNAVRLPLWAVKYRTKVQQALTHAWGRRLTSIVREILRKDGRTWNRDERAILTSNLDRWVEDSARTKTVRECVGFVLGVRERLTHPLFKAFEDAKGDLSAGRKLPLEVLEGIRSTFHKSTPKDEVLKLAAESGSLTDGQKLAVQKRAKAAQVEVQMDPTRYDAVRLYLYAFECGADEKVTAALDQKAREAAAKFPATYERLGIILDGSRSMSGSKDQPLRPMATALALRDMLRHTAQSVTMKMVGGVEDDGLVRPQGDTALADGLVELLSEDTPPEAIFVLSDGYENAPAGRFAEVVDQVREIGIDTPIYHLNPVFAAEAEGTRELGGRSVPTLPARDPAALGTTIVRGLIEAEPVKGINVLLRLALTGSPAEAKLLG